MQDAAVGVKCTWSSRPLGESFADQLGLVGSVIVRNDVDVEIDKDVALDLVEEPAKLLNAMAAHVFADDGSGCDVEGGEERGRSAPGVIVCAPLDLAAPHWRQGLGSIERLNVALLIDAESDGTVVCRQIKADNVADLLDEQRSGRELEGLRTMRLQLARQSDESLRANGPSLCPLSANSSASRLWDAPPTFYGSWRRSHRHRSDAARRDGARRKARQGDRGRNTRARHPQCARKCRAWLRSPCWFPPPCS